MFTKSATGWVPSKVAVQHEPELNDYDDLEGVSQEELLAAIAPSSDAPTPLGAQAYRPGGDFWQGLGSSDPGRQARGLGRGAAGP